MPTATSLKSAYPTTRRTAAAKIASHDFQKSENESSVVALKSCSFSGHRYSQPSALAFAAVISDMDGTLLNSSHCVSKLAKNVLWEICSRGAHFIFATGRHHDSVAKARNDLLQHFGKKYQESLVSGSHQIPAHQGFYLITLNGARVQNLNGDFIITHDLDSGIVRKLYERFSSRADDKNLDEWVSISAFQTDRWWLSRAFISEEQMKIKFGVSPEVVPDVLNAFPTEGVGRVCFRSFNAKLLHKYEEEINQMFSGQVTVVMSSNTCLDVLALGVSKGSAIREIALLLSFDPAKDAIAFGDSMNDMEMLKHVAKGCIMGNGQERLKAALPDLEIVRRNDEDGVALKLLEVFKLNRDELESHS